MGNYLNEDFRGGVFLCWMFVNLCWCLKMLKYLGPCGAVPGRVPGNLMFVLALSASQRQNTKALLCTISPRRWECGTLFFYTVYVLLAMAGNKWAVSGNTILARSQIGTWNMDGQITGPDFGSISMAFSIEILGFSFQ